MTRDPLIARRRRFAARLEATPPDRRVQTVAEAMESDGISARFISGAWTVRWLGRAASSTESAAAAVRNWTVRVLQEFDHAA